jgi:alcohol dehydrogenase
VAAGDWVAVEVFQSCRACPACRAGEYRRCARHGLADMCGFISVDREPGLWGGLCAATAAKEAGAGFVMVTGLGARDADRLALASKFGADLAVEVSADDPVVELTKATMAGERDDVPPVHGVLTP